MYPQLFKILLLTPSFVHSKNFSKVKLISNLFLEDFSLTDSVFSLGYV